MGKSQLNEMVSQNGALRIESADTTTVYAGSGEVTLANGATGGVLTPAPVADWKSRAIAGFDKAQKSEQEKQAGERGARCEHFERALHSLIGSDAIKGGYLHDDGLTITVDGTTFGYRSKFAPNWEKWSVFGIETFVDEGEYHTNDPDAPRREIWYGPLDTTAELGAFLLRPLSLISYLPRETPKDVEPAPLPIGTVAAALEALKYCRADYATANAQISIARSLEAIAASLGGDK